MDWIGARPHVPTSPGHLRATILGAERQVVELDTELVATGLYGIRRPVRSIGLSVDDPDRFLRLLDRHGRSLPARYIPSMAIIDEELFVRCERCGSEVATGIRRTENALLERPPGRRTIRCHRCGRVGEYGDPSYYHRTAAADADRVGA